MKKIISNSLFVEKNKKRVRLFYDKNIISDCSKEELIIKVKYTSINYKDILILNANPGLVRKFPHIGGIDTVGIVHKSFTEKFKKGEKVFIIGKPLGVKINGSYSEYIKVPIEWVDKLSNNHTMKQIIIFGTAGLTAAYAVENILQKNNNRRDKLPIIVTGPTGGVGSFGIVFLKKFGFEVEVLTRDNKSIEYLKKLKVDKVISIKNFVNKFKLPLGKIKYSSAIDNLGGEIVSPILSQIVKNGLFISIGNALNDNATISTLPFILRGIKLNGLNTESLTNSLRKKLINKYLVMLNYKVTKNLSTEIRFDQLKDKIKFLRNKKNYGRVIVKF